MAPITVKARGNTLELLGGGPGGDGAKERTKYKEVRYGSIPMERGLT